MLAIGPSMANIIQFYGHRKAYGLSVSPNPLHRNPVYQPVANPDLLIRDSEHPVPGVGRVLGRALAFLRAQARCATSSATTAAPSHTETVAGSHERRHDGRASR